MNHERMDKNKPITEIANFFAVTRQLVRSYYDYSVSSGSGDCKQVTLNGKVNGLLPSWIMDQH